MNRYTCNVHISFEVDAKTAGEVIDMVQLMLQFIESTIAIARGFRKATWYIPALEPRQVHPTEVSDG